MIIFLNMDGSCENVTPERVFQGSNNVTEVTVVAPFPSTTAMQIGFILPNGLYWQSSEGARYAPMEFVEQDMVDNVGVWHYDLPNALTAQQGELFISINAVTAQGNRTSYLCKQTIEESVLPNMPDTPTQSVYDLIQLYISRLQASTENVPNLVRGIRKVAPNAIKYIRNDGTESEKIVIEGGDTAPIPVNAASTITIAKDAWQPVYDSNSPTTITGYKMLIDADLHGQMRDEATAADLWVSFDETENGVISGAYQGYTVSESGDITINVNQPIDMTVRVWNGKGLVDDVAREMSDAETARAETAEDKLQSQIDEIVQSGIDLTAREQIADETERAKTAEQDLQSEIKTEANGLHEEILSETERAKAAENTLNQNIEKIESYIPSNTSADNQLADKAFVNSTVNNMSAFYITNNAKGDAFPTHASLMTATTFYSGGQVRVPTQNDYATVLADETKSKGVDGSYPTTRYHYQTDKEGRTYPNGQWEFQYVVNNTSLTQAQVDAINSGITKELVDMIGKGNVLSVNGETGAVTITPDKIGAVKKTGDVMTGALEIPMILGKDDTQNHGIIPLRQITRSELGVTTGDSIDVFLQAWLKKVCELYPNHKDCIFIGNGNPSSKMMIQAFIYDTSAVNEQGIPRYATGFCKQFSMDILYFNVNEYVIKSEKPYSKKNPPKKVAKTDNYNTYNSTGGGGSIAIGTKQSLSTLGITWKDDYVGGIIVGTKGLTGTFLIISKTQAVALTIGTYSGQTDWQGTIFYSTIE